MLSSGCATIEARVVHDRRRVAVFLEPLRVADFLERVHRAGLHVVLDPSVWPTSCATTKRSNSPIKSSGSGNFAARGSSGPPA